MRPISSSRADTGIAVVNFFLLVFARFVDDYWRTIAQMPVFAAYVEISNSHSNRVENSKAFKQTAIESRTRKLLNKLQSSRELESF